MGDIFVNMEIENFRTEKFRQKDFDKKLSDAFSGISNKHDIKKQVL